MRLFKYILFSLPLLIQANDEALFLRRIAEFWEEGEIKLAKNQMEEFISTYPQSPFSDQLCAALGDLYLREKNHSAAASYFSQIKSDEYIKKTFINRLHCLYELQWHATIVEACEAYIAKNGPELNPVYFLSLSLYQQCLNASKDPAVAERALPHFEYLSSTELSHETAPAYAHICCILKKYEKAAEIYSNLSVDDPEILFQVALLQSEFDKTLAIETFGKISQLGGARAKEAAYNQMVLKFESGRYEDVTIPNDIPEDRIPMAHLFLGRSYLALQKYPQAILEFQAFIKTSPPSETLHAAILNLLEAASHASDLESIDLAIAKLQEFYPDDAEKSKALFSRALVLKKNQRFEEAYQELETIPQIAAAHIELMSLDLQAKSLTTCRTRAAQFIKQNPKHELLPLAWKYFVATSTENKPQFITDLQHLISQACWTALEKKEWEYLLAKTYFDVGQCANIEEFCSLSEQVLTENIALVPASQIHLSLFNAYTALSNLDKSAEHLFAAFNSNAQIQEENLIWLSDYYYEHNPPRAAAILESLTPSEVTVCKLAKTYAKLNRPAEQVALLEKHPFENKEAELLLAEGYAALGQTEKAEQIFEAIVDASSSMRAFASASANLQAIRLKIAKQEDLEQVAVRLKDLVIQKTLTNEPVHLEAAKEYINLLGSTKEKRLELLHKMKENFTADDDLLSKDYQQARAKFPDKDQIVQNYLKWFDEEISR